jgi:diguanylate cyclase (GGDEF)-like protein
MLKTLEIQICSATFVVALLCSLVEAHFAGAPSAMTFVSPFVITGAVALALYLCVRMPFNSYMAAKRQNKNLPVVAKFDTLNAFVEEIVNAKISPLKTELAAAKADLADYVAKEVELNLIHRIDDELQNIHATDEALAKIINCIKDDLGDHIHAAVAYRQINKEDLNVSATWGIDEQHRKTLHTAVTRALPAIVVAPTPILWGRTDTAHLAHVVPPHTERVMIVPLKGSFQFIGCILLCVNTEREPMLSRAVRTMKKVGGHASRLLYRIALAEEREENRRRDKLTQAWNRTTLSERLLELTQSEGSSNLSLVLIEGDNFMSLNQAIGRERGDELIKTLGDTIKQNVKTTRTSGAADYFYRTGAAQFGLLLEGLDETSLFQVAERIRIAISQRSGWPGDVAQWSVSVGAATPNDSPQPSGLLAAAENALAYLKSQQTSNKVLFANQLPAKFKRQRSADAGVTGDLKVFDPGELLQSVAIARKSGILRVTAESGLEFWAFFSDGALKKAKLGNLRGDVAVIEFISTFDQGNFRFVESTPSDGGAEDPRSLGASYDTRDLNKLLLDGALAKDNLATARARVANLELYVAGVPESQRSGLWDKLKASGNPPTTTERSIMEEMLKLCNGSLKLKQIFQKLDIYPTPWLYYSAAMLIENNAVRLTAIKTYSHV